MDSNPTTEQHTDSLVHVQCPGLKLLDADGRAILRLFLEECTRSPDREYFEVPLSTLSTEVSDLDEHALIALLEWFGNMTISVVAAPPGREHERRSFEVPLLEMWDLCEVRPGAVPTVAGRFSKRLSDLIPEILAAAAGAA